MLRCSAADGTFLAKTGLKRDFYYKNGCHIITSICLGQEKNSWCLVAHNITLLTDKVTLLPLAISRHMKRLITPFSEREVS